jgi:hypothetical protein
VYFNVPCRDTGTLHGVAWTYTSLLKRHMSARKVHLLL